MDTCSFAVSTNSVSEFNRIAEEMRAKRQIVTQKVNVEVVIPRQVTFEVSSNAKSLLEVAHEMRDRRSKSTPTLKKEVPLQTPVDPPKSLVEIATEIQAKRMAVNTEVKTSKANTAIRFTCVRKNGEVIDVVPTIHAIDQFRWRYFVLNKKFQPNNEHDVLREMVAVFNKGKRVSNAAYLWRSKKRSESVSAMVWGTRTFKFVINPTTNTIITAELSGDYKKFNKAHFKEMIEVGTFNHDRMNIK